MCKIAILNLPFPCFVYNMFRILYEKYLIFPLFRKVTKTLFLLQNRAKKLQRVRRHFSLFTSLSKNLWERISFDRTVRATKELNKKIQRFKMFSLNIMARSFKKLFLSACYEINIMFSDSFLN